MTEVLAGVTPTNMMTTDTNQNITGSKTFTANTHLHTADIDTILDKVHIKDSDNNHLSIGSLGTIRIDIGGGKTYALNLPLRGKITSPETISTKEWVGLNYQPKLTAGTGITIDENNVISSSGGGVGQVNWSDILNKPTFATVATSGSYNDLSDKPTIPTKTSQLTNDSGFITSNALNGYATETWVGQQGYLTSVAWGDITDKPTLSTVATSGSYNDLTDKPTIPTTTGELTNDSGFITSNALNGYATTSDVSTAISSQTKETWTFTLSDGSTTTKTIVLG